MKSQRKNFRKYLESLQYIVANKPEWGDPVAAWSAVYTFYHKYMKAKQEYENHISGH